MTCLVLSPSLIMMLFTRTLSALVLLAASVASGRLLIDYRGGDPVSNLGTIELEGQELGEKIDAGTGGTAVFIKPEADSKLGVQCLHYKRDPHYRRAEVRALQDQLSTGKTYYIGYTLRLSRAHSGLVIFQWKKHDKDADPKQNIPIDLVFQGSGDSTTTLAWEYTTPGSDGSNRTSYWSGQFSTGSDQSDVHKIGIIINTANDGSGWSEFWLDGQQKLRKTGLYLYTGMTYPKWGIYRGEADAGDDSNPSAHKFNSYVHRVQFSDYSKAEVAEAAGW
ncbi:hypothetical protein EXIGLDRAFT_833088 [Exidia glandulosa HHB12029]|uniref:Polysaccharide lyase family 14 protein n=1 Tax=Exidia glandulosa HHB12029 TaxID=1314781 RepID=A0A165KYI6_EXIGL|nr:hypothetical protein EXIGLDRAFT_833088 [Exidia glandulosa HHB12029]